MLPASVQPVALIRRYCTAKLALEDKEDHVRIAAIRKLDDAETLAKAAELPDKGWDCPGWEAALRLSQIAPERAVEPLVQMMKSGETLQNVKQKLTPTQLPLEYSILRDRLS